MLGLIIAGFFAIAACDQLTTTEPITTQPTTTVTTTAPAVTTTTEATLSDAQKVQEVIDALTLGDISGVSADLTLPVPTTHGVTVTWATSDADIINVYGEVAIPAYDEGDATVTLTATVTLNAASETKDFVVTVLAETAEDFLTSAATAIIITGSDQITANFELPSLVRGATVTWTSNTPAVAAIAATVDAGGFWDVTITRPKAEEGGENTTVILTATLTIGDTSITATKTIRVIAEPPATVFTSFAELHAASSLNDYLDVTGIVFATFNGGYFLLDAEGDYLAVYTASVASFNNLVALGDSVRIKGLYKNYYTLYQINNLTYQEILSHDNDYTITPTVLEDALDLFDVDTDDRVIHGQIFTITATVKVVTGGYVDLYDGATRLGTVYSYSLTASINALKAVDGKLVTIDVVFYTLHPSNGIMVVFQGGADDIELVTLTGQAALDADAAAIVVPATAVGGQTLTLPELGTFGSAISWAVTAGGEYGTIGVDGDRITFVEVVAAQNVTLTATVTLEGATTATREFVVAVSPITTSTIAEVKAMTVAAQLIQVEGIVFFFTNNSYYIADATGMLNIYTVPAAGMALGDRVIIIGTLATYNSQIQITNAIVKSTVSTGNPYAQTVDVYVHGVTALVSGHTYAVTGTVAILGSNNYVYIMDGETILMAIYYRSTVDDSYNALKAFVGKEITFHGVYMYNGNDTNLSPAVASQIFFVYQEGTAGIALTDGQLALDDVEEVTTKTSVLSDEVVTLPTTATNGSTVTWAIKTGGTYAAIVGNVITYEEVAEATIVVLTATITYTPTVGDPIVTMKDVSVTISTYEEKLAADVAALTINNHANELDVVTLPIVGLNGSVITWELRATANATLVGNVLTLNYIGDDYMVILDATVTMASYSETKTFGVLVDPITVLSITEAVSVIRALTGSTDTLTGPVAFIMGTIIEFKTSSTAGKYSGAFITDGTQVIYCYYAFPKADYAIGDVVIIKGTLKSYFKLQEIDTTTVRVVLEGETPAEYEPVAATIAEIAAYTSATAAESPYLAQQVIVTGTVIKDGSNYFLSDGTKRLQFYYVEFSDGSILANLVGVEVVLTAVVGEYRTDGSIRLNGAFATAVVTDEVALAFDVAKLPTTLELTGDYTLPTPSFSAYDISAISLDLQPYLTENATGLTVTLPADADAVGTITVTVTKGLLTEDVVIDVTVKMMTDDAKLAADLDALPATLSLTANYVIPTPTFGTYSVDPIISAELTANVTLAGDKLSLLVTRPDFGPGNVVGTVTFTVTVGVLTDTKVVDVTVVQKTAPIVISQAYGGGGNSGSLYKNDFVELYNPTAFDVDISGWTIFYASTTGSFGTNLFTLPAGSVIKAESYFLIKMAAGSGGTVDLPTPDATGTIAMGGSGFKLALCSNNTVPTFSAATGDVTTTFTGTNLVDFLGCGAANQFEGTVAPAPSNANSVIRNVTNTDTNVNSADFTAVAANPRNSTYVAP